MVTLKVIIISSFVPSPSCRCGDFDSHDNFFFSLVPTPHVVVVTLKVGTITLVTNPPCHCGDIESRVTISSFVPSPSCRCDDIESRDYFICIYIPMSLW